MMLNHVLTKTAWEAALQAGEHAPPELARDGFLHCCMPEQLQFVLARHFGGVTNLLVIAFDTTACSGATQWVNSEPDQAPFPHLFGPIPCAAVSSVTPVP
jgi:uncharacterized protein (DUF952 family)